MYTTKLITHRGEQRIAVQFDRRPELITRFKQLEGARWSSTLKTWHLPDTKEYRKLFKITQLDSRELRQEIEHQLKIFEDWLKSKRYSSSTIRTYMGVVSVFFGFYNDKNMGQITNEDVIRFNNEYIIKRNLSSTYQNQFVNALKLFYQIVHNEYLEIDLIHRPKSERKLPHVLSKKEVKAILNSMINMKHRTMLSLIYACGLRRGELLNLKPNNILSDRHLLHIIQSKGRKDRIVPISDKTIEMLRIYYMAFRPKVWLFEGQVPGTQYSSRSIQLVMKQAVHRAKIQKPATLHWLRHSYATHLLDNGTDIRYIQELLGHNSSRTTEIYTHVSTRDIQKIKSPFDDL